MVFDDNFFNMILIFGIVALIGKGLMTFFSKKPVWFSNDEKDMKASDVNNVEMWNKSHAALWIGYAVAIIIGYGLERLLGDSKFATVPFFIAVVVPIPVMMKLHKKFCKLYKK